MIGHPQSHGGTKVYVQGPAGKDGKDGCDGRDGRDGRDGACGGAGGVGPEGPAGPEGPKGDTGPQGPAGSATGGDNAGPISEAPNGDLTFLDAAGQPFVVPVSQIGSGGGGIVSTVTLSADGLSCEIAFNNGSAPKTIPTMAALSGLSGGLLANVVSTTLPTGERRYTFSFNGTKPDEVITVPAAVKGPVSPDDASFSGADGRSPGSDGTARIQQAWDAAQANNTSLGICGTYYTTGQINAPLEASVTTAHRARIIAEGSQAAMIETPPGATVDIGKLDLIGNGSQIYLTRIINPECVRMEGGKYEGWRNGVYIEHRSDVVGGPERVSQIVLRDFEMDQPASAGNATGGHAVRILTTRGGRCIGKMIENVMVDNVRARGNAEDFQTGSGTADLITVRGANDVTVRDCNATAGGENGFAFTDIRGLKLTGNVAASNDGHGIQPGTSMSVVYVDDATGFAAGDVVTGTTVGEIGAQPASGTVRGIDVAANCLIIERILFSYFVVGDAVTNGLVTTNITTPNPTDGCRRVSMSGNVMFNNGRDYSGSGTNYAGIFAQHVRGIGVDVSNISDANHEAFRAVRTLYGQVIPTTYGAATSTPVFFDNDSRPFTQLVGQHGGSSPAARLTYDGYQPVYP